MSAFLDAASRVSPPAAVCSTEQAAAMFEELQVNLAARIEAPVKQGYATRAQLSAYFGFESVKGFNPQLDMLLARHSDKIRRFSPEYVNARGTMSTGVERFCIEDVERLVLGLKKKGGAK